MNTQPLSPDELLSTTRSVRKRLDLQRLVPMELVRDCLRIAVQAPTGSNRQDWHWIVVTDPAARAQIGDYYRRSFERYYGSRPAPERLYPDDPARADAQRRVAASAVHLAERMGEVPVLVIAAIKLDSARLPEGNQAGLWGSLLPAVTLNICDRPIVCDAVPTNAFLLLVMATLHLGLRAHRRAFAPVRSRELAAFCRP